MNIKSRAIVLNSLRYGDDSLIVALFVEKLGRQSVFIKKTKNKQSGMRLALFQPLQIVEADFIHREKRQLQQIKNTQIFYHFYNIPFNPVKCCIAIFIAEILYKTLKEENKNVDLFEFLLQTIQTLDLNNTGTANFHIAFLIHYSRYLGFSLKHENILPQNFEIHFQNIDKLKLNRIQRNNITEILLERYALHVDNFGKLKSFPVLQSVFS